MPKSRALLLSGYHAISQKLWADYVCQTCTDYDWTTIALPARYFSWRMRGAPLSISVLDSEKLSQQYDLILATSSIDLSVVQSIYPTLRNAFSILYFHENQFAYPPAHRPQAIVDWQMVNLYSALRADKIIFNSHYNRDSLSLGLKKLLKKLPDLVPKNLLQSIVNKSTVLSVPIRKSKMHDKTPTPTQNDGALKLLWNHRWEWDKNPELLLAITTLLEVNNINFKLFITGQQFRQIPDALLQLKDLFPHRIQHSGFIADDDQYLALVNQCHIVLSTAVHEFQGIAIMEAVNNGCIPLLPNRLSYPEFFNTKYLYEDSLDTNQQATAAVDKVSTWLCEGFPACPSVINHTEEALVRQYQQEIRHNPI